MKYEFYISKCGIAIIDTEHYNNKEYNESKQIILINPKTKIIGSIFKKPKFEIENGKNVWIIYRTVSSIKENYLGFKNVDVLGVFETEQEAVNELPKCKKEFEVFTDE